MSEPSLALVPPRRLGALLRDTRAARGVGIEALARQSFFTPDDLREIEAGERSLTDRELAEVLGVYHVEADDLVPTRTALVIDLEDRLVAAGGHQRGLVGRAPSPDEVLASYLSLVYTLRNAEPGVPLVLREADLEVLARALDLARSAVTARLHALMTEPEGTVRRRVGLLRGRVLVPVAGVVVAATAVGVLLLVGNDPGQAVETRPEAVPPPAFVLTNPDGSTTPVYVGDDLDPSELPPGAVALAPAQVAEQAPDGSVTQSTRRP